TAGRILRDRSRDLVRNNPHVAKAVEALVSNAVGTGVRPRPKLDDKDQNKKVVDAFNKWAKAGGCDQDGQLDFYGLQHLAVREMIEGGEVLIRRSLTKSSKKQDVPLQLQLLEADFLDPFKNGPLSEGTFSIQGVEISSSGDNISKRVAYWLYEQHPGTLFFNTAQSLISKPVPASEVLHVYEKQRTQMRGVPWGTPSFETLKHLADYELAEIVRKRTEACMVALITTEDEAQVGWNHTDPDGIHDTIQAGAYDRSGNPIDYFEPGQIGYISGGKTVAFNSPASIGGYNEYKTSQLRTAASGFRVPYELLSGDLSSVNFSSMRGGTVEFRRIISSIQARILVPMFLDPVWEWWCEAAFLAGVIDTPDVPVDWAFPKWEYVNPTDDVAAQNEAIRSGLTSWAATVADAGFDPDELYEEIKAFQDKASKDGVVLDSDPRASTGRGVAQKSDEPSKGKGSKKKKKKTKKQDGAIPADTPDQSDDDTV
ncbi:phage portal protein, partial [Beijerinckia sp. L45]|uniref:phage portal protein n=1 Tax=Beijerinckia sp. L45 TaxID=1641855 RepID=UPI00131C60BD